MDLEKIKQDLQARQQALQERLERITDEVRSPLEADSEEQVVVRENQEVIDDLGNIARQELRRVTSALVRMDAGEYGVCIDCGAEIPEGRLEANPFAERCVECEERYEKSEH
jgi:RNA polymerase-binding protein DksA